MPKPLNESSNSNQSKTPYEFNNRKSGFFSNFGYAEIAVGSLATALSIGAPSVGAHTWAQHYNQRLWCFSADYGKRPAQLARL